MFEVLTRIADSDMPGLLSLLLLVVAAVYYGVFVTPKLQKLKEYEKNIPSSNAEAHELVDKVDQLTEAIEGIANSVSNLKENFGDHSEVLEDIQYSCHNTRHELSDVKARVQNIASTLRTEGRDSEGFCDLRELR